MRSFIVACCAIIVIALAAAATLKAIQKPVAVAFSTSEVRL